jgi:hypothetical protein
MASAGPWPRSAARRSLPHRGQTLTATQPLSRTHDRIGTHRGHSGVESISRRISRPGAVPRSDLGGFGVRYTMTYVDFTLVNALESLCRRFQRLTGRTNVWLALQLTNLSIVMYFVGAGVYLVRISLAPRIALALFCAALLYALTQTVFKVPIEVYEHNAYRRVARGLGNPRRVRDVPLRIAFLTLSLLYPMLFLYQRFAVPPVVLLGYSLIVLTTVVLYLLACDPLPPCPGTLRARIANPARVPVPVPRSPGDRSRASRTG